MPSGFLTIIGFIIFVGWVSSYFIMESVINFFWPLDLERTPNKTNLQVNKRFFVHLQATRKIYQSRITNVFNNDVWIVGFLTDDEMDKFNMEADMVAVYVPQTPTTLQDNYTFT